MNLMTPGKYYDYIHGRLESKPHLKNCLFACEVLLGLLSFGLAVTLLLTILYWLGRLCFSLLIGYNIKGCAPPDFGYVDCTMEGALVFVCLIVSIGLGTGLAYVCYKMVACCQGIKTELVELAVENQGKLDETVELIQV